MCVFNQDKIKRNFKDIDCQEVHLEKKNRVMVLLTLPSILGETPN